MFKQACKEAFREELKEILLESIKSSKTQIIENSNKQIESPKNLTEKKSQIKNLMENMYSDMNKIGNNEEIPFQVNNINTSTEGSSLPSGEVPLDFINKLTGIR